MSKEKEIYDNELVYNDQIYPLMDQIIKICQENEIPMAATFQYANYKKDGAAFCTTTLGPERRISEELRQVIDLIQPLTPIAIAEIHVTNPDGSKTITITKV